MTAIDVRANLERVNETIAQACARAGRSPGDVLLIGVSKTVDAERILAAVRAGVPALGENRVQEARDKVAALGRPVPWHLIGSLQTNKARDAARCFDVIQSVDRKELALELDRRARADGKVLDVLVQVNVGDEPQKGGVGPADLDRLLEEVRALSALRLRGLMTIPPATERADEARPWFRRLRELRDRAGLEHLSMGMSADFDVAIEEGATMVRVGTAIFGARPPRGEAAEPGGPATAESGAGSRR